MITNETPSANKGNWRIVPWSAKDLEEVWKRKIEFGVTDHGISTWQAPEIKITQENGTYLLMETMAKMGTVTTQICPKGKVHLGNFFYCTLNSQSLMRHSQSQVTIEASKISNFQPKSVSDYTFFLDITQEVYAEIEKGESEHKDDFEMAFALSYQKFADTINMAAGKYKSKEEAIKKLIGLLTHNAPQLIPQDPSNLSSWMQHLHEVAAELCNYSSDRDNLCYDKRKHSDHKVVSYIATPVPHSSENVYYLTPKFDNPHRAAKDIIRLERVKSIYTGSPSNVTVMELHIGSQARLRESTPVTLYADESMSGTDLAETIPAGTVVTIRRKVSSNVSNNNTSQDQILVQFDVIQNGKRVIDDDNILDAYNNSSTLCALMKGGCLAPL